MDSSQNLIPLIETKKNSLPQILIVAAAVFIIDQLAKFWVVHYLPMGGTWSLTTGTARLAQITFITNTGAAFGMFPQLGTIFMVSAMVVIVGIVFFHRQLPLENGWVRLSLGLQLGGAMGNLFDRLTQGYVVDFIDIGFWPIFNIADVSIMVGVSTLTYYFWCQENTLDYQELSGISEGKNNE